ncbi:calcitonin gene-related peptide 1 [Stigmatopora nigra]
MYHHPRVFALVLIQFALLHCIATAPGNRHSSSNSFNDEGKEEEWSVFPFSNPFLSVLAARSQPGLPNKNSHSIQKRKCNTATCVTQRLADFLVRSSNTFGTVYTPTNVGSATYGKRALLLPSSYYLSL